MTTERQSESARINGAKSHGPISAEGKEKSSRNSLRHGCTASHTLLLACEDPGDLDRMLEKYNAMYKPTTLEEHDLVAEMCSARWRIRRATVSDAPEECAPPAPAAPPPAIPPSPMPEARCSRQPKISQNNHPPVQAKVGRV